MEKSLLRLRQAGLPEAGPASQSLSASLLACAVRLVQVLDVRICQFGAV